MRALSLFLCPFLLVSSCTLAPKKETPPVALSSSYLQNHNLPETGEGEVDLSRWWQQFQDPLLDELVGECIKKNFDILTATEQINSARAALTFASSRLLPTLNLFGMPARLKTSNDLTPTTTSAAGTPTKGSRIRSFFIAGFDADWEIDFFGKNLSAKEDAYYTWLAAKEKVYFLKVVMVAEVVSLYTEIRSLQKRLSITQDKIKVFEELLQLTDTLKQAGLRDLISVEEKIGELNKAKSLEPALKELLEQTIGNLAFLLGGDVNDYHQRFAQPGRIPLPFGKVPVGLPSDLIKRRPDIQEAEYNLFASFASIGQARASLLPSFALSGVMGDSSLMASHFFWKTSRFWAALPTIKWEIFQGGRLLAQLELATSQQKISAIAYEKAVFKALKEVENSLVGYTQSGLKTRDLLLDCQAKKTITTLSRNKFEAGLSNLLDLLDRYEDLFNAQELYIQSKEETMIKLVNLYKSLGGDLES